MPELNRELTLMEQYRESHHAIAMMFAADMTPSMIRQKTGRSLYRLSTLYNDPSFQELISIYRKRMVEKFNAALDSYTDLGMSNMLRAESLIGDKLNSEDAEDIPLLTLSKISEGRADRFGYSKHSIHHHEHSFAEALDRAITRSNEARPVESSGTAGSIPATGATAERLVSRNSLLIEGRVVEVSATPDTVLPSVLQESKPQRLNAHKASTPSFARVLGPVKRRRVA